MVPQARRWLDRACRLAPRDQTLALALATACLGHDDMRAAALFGTISAENDVREAWLGLATARRRLGDAAGAAAALAAALRRHVPDPGFAALADAIAREAGAPGWCGLSGMSCVRSIRAPSASSRAAPSPRPPPARGGERFAVTARDGRHFLGSPIDVAAITAAVGCVSGKDGGLTGWAWHPGESQRRSGTDDPSGQRTRTDHDHRIRCRRADRQQRPAGTASRLHRAGGCVARAERTAACAGRDGRDLLGSPLDPGAELEAGAAAADMLARTLSGRRRSRCRARPPRPIAPPAMPVATMLPPMLHAASRRRPPVDVVVPVHGGAAHTLACLDSVLAACGVQAG